ISILQNILDVVLPHSILIDYRHIILLRHAKTVLSEIYKQLKPLDRERFAVELRNILFHEFPPLSLDFINIELLGHFALFVCSKRLWHSQSPMFANETQVIVGTLFDHLEVWL
ncbi:unnamed protein product, partial [Adineta steineri]